MKMNNQHNIFVTVTLNLKNPEDTIQGIYLDTYIEEESNEIQALIGTRFGILRVDIDNPNTEIAFNDVKPAASHYRGKPGEISPIKIFPPRPGGTISGHLEQMRQAIETLLNVFAADPEELSRIQEAEFQRIEVGIDRLRTRADCLERHP
jgi:hypothetical protein